MSRFLLDAGVFAYPVILLGVVGLVLGFVHLILATFRTRRDVEGLVLAGIGVTLAAGLLGCGEGIIHTFQALEAMAPDQRAAMLLMSLRLALDPLLLAMGLAAGQVALTMVARTIRATRAVRS